MSFCTSLVFLHDENKQIHNKVYIENHCKGKYQEINNSQCGVFSEGLFLPSVN